MRLQELTKNMTPKSDEAVPDNLDELYALEAEPDSQKELDRLYDPDRKGPISRDN